MFGSKNHQTYVSTEGRGYGRYVHTWACTCGAQGGYAQNRQRAEASARKHGKTGR